MNLISCARKHIKWLPFILLVFIYIVSTLSISYNRYLHCEELLWGWTDYALHARLCNMASKGINPYSVKLHVVDGWVVIPYLYNNYAGNSVFNAIVLHISGASPEVVVSVISPMLACVFLLLAVCAVCRMMNFDPKQSFFFLLFFCFLNDQVLYRSAYGGGELIGTAIGLVGLCYFMKKKYLLAIPFIGISSWLHLTNIAYLAILIIWFVLSMGYDLVKNNFQVRGLIGKINFRNIYVKQALSLFAISLIVGAFLYPLFQHKTYYWTNDQLIETKEDPIEPIDPQGPEDFVEPEINEFTPETKWGVITTSSDTDIFSSWIMPQRLTDFILLSLYPFTSLYTTFFPRSSFNCTLRLFGYNLTTANLDSIRSFSLNTPIFILAVPIIYGLGFPLLFLISLWECYKSQDKEKTLLVLAAYLLIIFVATTYFLFDVSMYGQRFIRYVGSFWVFALIPSRFINPTSKIKRFGLYFFSLLLIARFIIYFMAVMY